MNAADLPTGSIVASRDRVWIKTEMTYGLDRNNWACSTRHDYCDAEINELLAGDLASLEGETKVLRVGRDD